MSFIQLKDDQKNHSGNQVDIGAAGIVSGLFLPGSHIPDDTFLLPTYTHLLSVCHRSGEDSRAVQRIPDGDQPDPALPPLGYQRI